MFAPCNAKIVPTPLLDSLQLDAQADAVT